MKTDTFICGHNLLILKRLPDARIDAVVTDPPYGLKFMGKAWDHDVPKAALWRQVLRVLKPGGHLLSFFGTRTYHRGVCAIEDAGFEIRDMIEWVYAQGFPKSLNLPGGIGTGLKPSHEPIVLARKPLEGTVAGNVLKHGTGGMNVDGCRIGDAKRWPANLIHDGSPEVLACFPQAGKESAARYFYCAKASRAERDAGCEKMEAKQIYNCDNSWGGLEIFGTTDGGRSPARNNHATVKPLALMRYLCRLITPPGGLVLDPFCGSGSTCVAAMQEGFSWLGIDRDAHSIEIAEARMAHWRAERGD